MISSQVTSGSSMLFLLPSSVE